VQGFIAGKREETDFSDSTSGSRRGWRAAIRAIRVNRTLFVAEGRGYPGYGVEYRVFRVA